MRWAQSLYTEEPALRFMRQPDLSSGAALYDKCDSACKWYMLHLQ